jgi:hypothetical protein
MPEIDPLLAEELWRRGELRWLLRPYQEEFYDQVWAFLRKESAKLAALTGVSSIEAWRKLFEDCHRRYGKSFTLFLIGCEVGLGKACRDWPARKRVIRFAAPTMLDLEEIYHPIAEDLFEDCPDDVRPQWRTTRGRGHYLFPSTESQLFLFGVDAKHYKKGRGKRLHLGVVDEVGSCEPGHPKGIEHVVNSILLPQTFGIDGCIVMATTPPETPGHASGVLKSQCQSTGAYFRRTLLDTAHYFGPDVVDEYARESGGKTTTAFRREYLCEWIVDEERAAVPEWEANAKRCVVEFEPPAHYLPLEAMDVGFEDWHAIGFGWWNFDLATLDVWDVEWLRRTTTDGIAAAIKAKEAQHWPWAAREFEQDADGAWVVEPWRTQRKAPLRYSDTDLRLIADLSTDHALPFAPTAKDEKEAQVNELRRFVASARVRIHPRCAPLIHDLQTTIWNRQRTEWERTADGHHGDGVDMLLYMLRNAPRNVNPYPPKWAGVDLTRNFAPPPDQMQQAEPALAAWSAIFGTQGGNHG